MIADVFEDDSSPDERRFGRLRELCGRPAWTVREAAWIICGFDRENYRKGDYSPGESDGWALLPGVTRDRHEPDPKGMSEEDLRQLRRERFQERCDTDEARHSRIGMTALRLAGLLPGGMQSAHPPRSILEKAVTAGMAPPWLDYARADPELARILPAASSDAPAAPASPIVYPGSPLPLVHSVDSLHPVPGSPRKRRQGEPCPAPHPKMIARWPSLYARAQADRTRDYRPKDVLGAGSWSNLKGLRRTYPCYAHMLAFAEIHRHETPKWVADALNAKWPELKLSDDRETAKGRVREASFSHRTIARWRNTYRDREEVVGIILAWVLLGIQVCEPPEGREYLYGFLTGEELRLTGADSA